VPEQPLNPLDLLTGLRTLEVEFIVIGGYCLAAHGYVRGTKDVDIVPEPEQANFGGSWPRLGLSTRSHWRATCPASGIRCCSRATTI
jgi:hypothetical protein